MAVRNGYIEVVKELLIRFPPEIDRKNVNMQTALTMAFKRAGGGSGWIPAAVSNELIEYLVGMNAKHPIYHWIIGGFGLYGHREEDLEIINSLQDLEKLVKLELKIILGNPYFDPKS